MSSSTGCPATWAPDGHSAHVLLDESTALGALWAVAARQDAVVTARDLAEAGLREHVARRMVRAAQWQRLLRGSYLVRPERAGPRLARSWSRSASLVVPGAVAARGSAASLLGVVGAPLPVGADVVVPPGLQKPSRTELHVVVSELRAGDVVDVRGIATTSPVRTLADLVPRLSRPEALAALDSALAAGVVDRGGLREARSRCCGRRGSRAVEDLWDLADPRAESVLESRARLVCVEGGVPPDDLQVVVMTPDGHVVARGDIGFRRRRRRGRGLLLLECDGREVHSAPEALFRDRWRANALVALGIDVIRCTWADVLHPARLVAMVEAAL